MTTSIVDQRERVDQRRKRKPVEVRRDLLRYLPCHEHYDAGDVDREQPSRQRSDGKQQRTDEEQVRHGDREERLDAARGRIGPSLSASIHGIISPTQQSERECGVDHQHHHERAAEAAEEIARLVTSRVVNSNSWLPSLRVAQHGRAGDRRRDHLPDRGEDRHRAREHERRVAVDLAGPPTLRNDSEPVEKNASRKNSTKKSSVSGRLNQ